MAVLQLCSFDIISTILGILPFLVNSRVTISHFSKIIYCDFDFDPIESMDIVMLIGSKEKKRTKITC